MYKRLVPDPLARFVINQILIFGGVFIFCLLTQTHYAESILLVGIILIILPSLNNLRKQTVDQFRLLNRGILTGFIPAVAGAILLFAGLLAN